MKSTLQTLATVATALLCFIGGNSFAAVAKASSIPDTLAIPNCNWNHPGANPFMGDVVAAVDRYQDIPAPVRARLKERMAKRAYDEVVDIKRDVITGRDEYSSEIADMHFGTRQLCHKVTRAAWTPQMLERGLVYCEDGHCILIPTVCRNVSRIQRRAVHNQPMHSTFVPTPAAAYPAAASISQDPALDPAGPIGAAAGGSGVASPMSATSSEGAVAGMAFAAAAAAGGGGGSSTVGSSVDKTLASAKQSTGMNTPTADVYAEPPVIAAPVPEPETWALMTVGLFSVVRMVVVRRRKARVEA